MDRIKLPSLPIKARLTPFQPQSLHRLRKSDPSAVLKLTLRLPSALAAFLSLSLFAAAIPQWDAHFEHTDKSVTKGDWQDGLPLASLVIVVCWNVGSALWSLKSGRRVHAGVNLGVDSIVWALLVPGLVFSVWGGLFRFWDIKGDGTGDCSETVNEFTTKCSPEVLKIGRVELAAVVFAFMVWVLQSLLLALSAIEMYHHRRRANQRIRNGGFEVGGNQEVPMSFRDGGEFGGGVPMGVPMQKVVYR